MSTSPDIYDNGIYWCARHPEIPYTERPKLTLELLVQLISADRCESNGYKNDFSLKSNLTENWLKICLGLPERVAMLYEPDCKPPHHKEYWTTDPANKGSKICVLELDQFRRYIPAQYFVPKDSAICQIREFWNSGIITDLSDWTKVERKSIDWGLICKSPFKEVVGMSCPWCDSAIVVCYMWKRRSFGGDCQGCSASVREHGTKTPPPWAEPEKITTINTITGERTVHEA